MAGIKEILDGVVTAIDNTVDAFGTNIKSSADEKAATVKYIDAKANAVSQEAAAKAEREKTFQKILLYSFYVAAFTVIVYVIVKFVIPAIKK